MQSYDSRHTINMGHSASKNPKINKNHNKQRMFRVGISVGRNDLNIEGHVQMGYSSKDIKNYKPIEGCKPVESNAQNEEIIIQDRSDAQNDEIIIIQNEGNLQSDE